MDGRIIVTAHAEGTFGQQPTVFDIGLSTIPVEQIEQYGIL